MNNDSYAKLLQKQKQFEDVQKILESFKSIILGTNENTQTTSQINKDADYTDILLVKYLNRTIRIYFKNNFNGGEIDFLLEKLNKNNDGFIYESIVTVVSDSLGNVSSEEVGFKNQTYKDVHFVILNYILDQSISTGKKKKHTAGFVNR